jgi:hypothetical protein
VVSTHSSLGRLIFTTQVFDVLSVQNGEAKLKTYPHPERTYYYKVDISDLDQVQSACDEALKVIPRGSLAGGVHCAAVATSRKWSKKMVDSIKVRCSVLQAVFIAETQGFQENDGCKFYRDLHHRRLHRRRHQFPIPGRGRFPSKSNRGTRDHHQHRFRRWMARSCSYTDIRCVQE